MSLVGGNGMDAKLINIKKAVYSVIESRMRIVLGHRKLRKMF